MHFGMAVFAAPSRSDFAAEAMGNVLQAVADSEDGGAEREHAGVGGRRVGVIDGAGAAGEDDSEGMVCLDFGEGHSARQDHAEDLGLADAAGDELGVLRSEVEDDDGLVDELGRCVCHLLV